MRSVCCIEQPGSGLIVASSLNELNDFYKKKKMMVWVNDVTGVTA